MTGRRATLPALAALGVLLAGVVLPVPDGVAADAPGRRSFVERRDPPAYRALTPGEQALYELGHAVFNTHWVSAGTPGGARRDGIGPLYNSESCDSCHNEGARGRGPFGDGTAPGSLVFQLGVWAAEAAGPADEWIEVR